MKLAIVFDPQNFQEFFKRNPEGSFALGYIREMTLVYTDSNGESVSSTYRDVAVRRNVEGNFTIAAPAVKFEGRNGNTVFKSLWRLDDRVYSAVVTHLATREPIATLLKRAESEAQEIVSAPSQAVTLRDAIALLAQSNPEQLATIVNDAIGYGSEPSASVQPELPLGMSGEITLG